MTQSSAALTKTSRAPLLDSNQAAEYLGVSNNTLPVWRCTGRHLIPYIKVGRLVRYRQKDLDAFLEKNTIGAESTP